MSDIFKINKAHNVKPKVIVAPLDWGLGHATRCIPIIRQLLKADYEVIIAAENAQMHLLKDEFPFLRFVRLHGYRLKFGKKSVITTLKIFLQIPKILIQINREKHWLNTFLKKENIDAVISDNRFGLNSKKVISVFITHQLCIKMPFGKWAEKKLQQLNYKHINKFTLCWVPDLQKNNSLAGELSHPKKFPKTSVHYIGALSRFEKKDTPAIYKLMILLSGPEPQRTILENIFLTELDSYNEKIILVRGLPGEKKSLYVSAHLEVYNHLAASELNEKICQSELIISRSGYSTVMDLAKLEKRSIMIPTPGQTEQEYLADYLFQKKMALKINQKDFSLRKAIEAAEKFSFKKLEEENNHLLDGAINELTAMIQRSKQ